MDALTDAVANACTPPIAPEIRIRSVEGKAILDMEILPGQNKPYYIRKEGIGGGVYVRIGATTRQAEPEQLQELILQGRHQSYDEQPSGETAPDPELIDKLCRQIGKSTGKQVTQANLVGWSVLIQNKSSILPTNAFELLTRNPAHFAKIQCACFKGTQKGTFIDKADIEGPVQEQIEQVYRFVLRNIRLEARVEGLYRVEHYELPEEAIREAIINAVVHRNYLQHAFIQVAIYDDRLEIVSPGGLYGITMEQAETGTSSIRNKVLADVFSRLRLVERWGTGLLKIKEMCRAAGIAAPEFCDNGAAFTIIFRRRALKHQTLQNSTGKEVSENEQSVLAYLKENNRINNEKGRALTGLSRAGMSLLFHRLVERRFICPESASRNRSYVLSLSVSEKKN